MTEDINKFSIGQAAKVLAVSVRTLRRWDESGRLPARRTDSGHRYYTRAQLERFLQRNRKIRYVRKQGA